MTNNKFNVKLFNTMAETKTIKVKTDSIISIAEASKILGVSKMTIYRWVRSGKITSVCFGFITYLLREEVERISDGKIRRKT